MTILGPPLPAKGSKAASTQSASAAQNAQGSGQSGAAAANPASTSPCANAADPPPEVSNRSSPRPSGSVDAGVADVDAPMDVVGVDQDGHDVVEAEEVSFESRPQC